MTPDYVIGPGHEILIRGWGQIDLDVRAVVDRNGVIYIPRVGDVNVTGVKYEDLLGILRTAIGRSFRQFELTASLVRLRFVVCMTSSVDKPGGRTPFSFRCARACFA